MGLFKHVQDWLFGGFDGTAENEVKHTPKPRKVVNSTGKSLVLTNKYALDKSQPDKKYTMYQIIAEYGRMKGHIERLEKELLRREQVIAELMQKTQNKKKKEELGESKLQILELIGKNKLTKKQLLDKIMKTKKVGVSSKSRAYGIISELIKDEHIIIQGKFLTITGNS